MSKLLEIMRESPVTTPHFIAAETVSRSLTRTDGTGADEPEYTLYSAVIAANQKSRNFLEIDLEGIDVANYEKNPIVLFNHDDGRGLFGGSYTGGVPIAKSLSVEMKDGRLNSQFRFLDGDPMAERVKNAWDNKFLCATSIQVMPTVIEEVTNEMGEMERVIVRKSELLEWSIVSIPADPDAVSNAIKRKLGETKQGFNHLPEGSQRAPEDEGGSGDRAPGDATPSEDVEADEDMETMTKTVVKHITMAMREQTAAVEKCKKILEKVGREEKADKGDEEYDDRRALEEMTEILGGILEKMEVA